MKRQVPRSTSTAFPLRSSVFVRQAHASKGIAFTSSKASVGTFKGGPKSARTAFHTPPPNQLTLKREITNAICEGARNARGGEQQFAAGRGLPESNLHLFELIQLQL